MTKAPLPVPTPVRKIGPEDESRNAPPDASSVPSATERATDLGTISDPQRAADKMADETTPDGKPADDLARGIDRRRRHPGREDFGH